MSLPHRVVSPECPLDRVFPTHIAVGVATTAVAQRGRHRVAPGIE